MRRAAAILGILVAAMLGGAGAAEAHAFAQRYDLPLPLRHYLFGAGAAVALSFLVAALFVGRGGAGLSEREVPLPEPATRMVRAALRLASAVLFVLLIAAGLFGNQDDWDRNLLPVAVWVLWWVGLAFVCALVGDVWSLVNPWVAIGEGVAALCRRLGRVAPARTLPSRVGVWPSVILFLGFAWVELVWPSNAVPAKLATAILLYSALTWAGMAVFGVHAWARSGEVFTQVFGLFGRFAPLAAREAGGNRVLLVLRPYGAGLARAPVPSASMTALVLAVLATVSFDGISETPFWLDLSGRAMQALYELGVVHRIGYGPAGALVKTLGLLAMPLAFAALYLATAALVARADGAATGTVARRFVFSLVPIAIGYHLAHYFSYLLIQGQMAIPLLGDPFGLGWNPFGLAGRGIDIGIVDMRLVWLVAVAGVVLGHVAAVFVAHAAALADGRTRPGRAIRSQLPLVLLMIAYTILSLWILSQPIVEA